MLELENERCHVKKAGMEGGDGAETLPLPWRGLKTLDKSFPFSGHALSHLWREAGQHNR